MKTDRELLIEANSIIRSFKSVIDRQGKEANWEGLDIQASRILKEQHLVLYPISEQSPSQLPANEITDEIERYINSELPDANKTFHYQAEIAFGLREFAKWYRNQISKATPQVSNIKNVRCADCHELIGNNVTHICEKQTARKMAKEAIENIGKHKIRAKKVFDFVVSHKTLIYQTTRFYGNFTSGKHDTQLHKLIELARKEIGYADATWAGDIFNSLIKQYMSITIDGSENETESSEDLAIENAAKAYSDVKGNIGLAGKLGYITGVKAMRDGKIKSQK